jgi:hypothetical protein
VTQATVSEKIMEIGSLEREIENLKAVHEAVLIQKKDYIKKLFNEMDDLRASIS